MKLVLMTKPTFFVEEDKILSNLLEEGMDYLHINKPESSPMFTERLLSLIPEEYHNKIVVHGHYYLKDEYGLRGIHIDDPLTPLPQGYKGKFSRTCTVIEQLKEAKKKSEYVFLKSVAGENADNEPGGDFTIGQLADARKQGLIDKHVYALGGLNIDNLKEIKQLGFGGAVICEDIWARFDIHKQQDYKDLLNHFVKIKKIVD
ncbi:MAG: thiamine phosphate synthase [Prevotella sp.]|uniref:thiamine phosphate synthase n=1 Tax=Prevotella sp. TaxID=59823 RepID=UPI002A2B739C|nr:thiamine phosphate synthase [Prevotella sp.]MDD7319123.1 thiamine phosphate synthase [Prevotellaceae bacterium]MDY4019602.1 thiamine phosphate synthase [Prevotella sp.]